jgi:hypothetical protein
MGDTQWRSGMGSVINEYSSVFAKKCTLFELIYDLEFSILGPNSKS